MCPQLKSSSVQNNGRYSCSYSRVHFLIQAPWGEFELGKAVKISHTKRKRKTWHLALIKMHIL